MDFKKLSRIEDSAQGGLLYGATKDQWINSLAQDDGGVGFGDPSTGDYSFNEESIGQMGCSCFDDGGMALNHPEEVDQWALDHDMESKAEEFVTKKLDFLKGMSSDSKKDYYCYYGGVVIYCPDEDFREDSQYEVLVPNDKIKDSLQTGNESRLEKSKGKLYHCAFQGEVEICAGAKDDVLARMNLTENIIGSPDVSDLTSTGIGEAKFIVYVWGYPSSTAYVISTDSKSSAEKYAKGLADRCQNYYPEVTPEIYE